MRRVLALAFLLLLPARSQADWLITPFVGTTFSPSTNILFASQAGNKKFTFGGSYGFLTDGLLGIEASVAHIPRYFETRSGTNIFVSSGMTTLDGNFILAVPQAITGYSLRPYAVAGVGQMHAGAKGALNQLASFDTDQLALNVGGGAIGMLSNRTGVRFDVRNYRNLKPDDSADTISGSIRISFWRASFGVVIRY